MREFGEGVRDRSQGGRGGEGFEKVLNKFVSTLFYLEEERGVVLAKEARGNHFFGGNCVSGE